MRNLVQIRDEIQSLCDTGEAILAIAEKENRDLSVEEQSQLDDIYGTDKADGKLAALKAEEARMERINAERREIAARRAAEKGLFKDSAESAPQDRKIVVPAVAKRHGKLKAFDTAENAYVSGQFLAATIFGSASSQRWLDDHGIKAAHSTGDNSKGGYAVPEPMEQSIIRLVEERGTFRQNAFVYPMSSGSIVIPRRSGGFVSYFVGENAAITASDLTLNQVKLEAKKLGVLTQISSELSEDAIVALAELVTQEIAYAFADKEDQCGFNGDGTSAYGGIVGLNSALAAGSIQDAIAGNDSALELDLADFESTISKLPRFPGLQAKWYVHSAVYWASMARLMDAAGGNTMANLAGGPSLQFLGYPVELVNVMPSTTGTLASTIVAYFGDLSMAATLGTRRNVTIRTDDSKYFAEDAMAIRATERFDINVHERGSASEAGPIIGLKTAS